MARIQTGAGNDGRPVSVGDRAPDFTLTAHDGTDVRLADIVKDRCVVLFFYPSDFTMVCTAEVCNFRDQYELFVEAGAEVIGISSDEVDSHRRFASQLRLPYRLISDPDGEVRRRFGVPKALMLFPGRTTYVIDRQQIVRHVFTAQMSASSHISEALRIVRELVGPGR